MSSASETASAAGGSQERGVDSQTKTCERCGVEFSRSELEHRITNETWRNRRYCSAACRWPNRHTYRNCEQCGRSFHSDNITEQRFCSRPCAYDARRLGPPPAERTCAREGCDEHFTPRPYLVAAGNGRYCSVRCSNIDAGRRGSFKRGDYVNCPECGRPFYLERRHVEAGRRFCSSTCWGTWRWKHGELPESQIATFGPRGNQHWLGRWGGVHGAIRGHEGGAPRLASEEQVEQVWKLYGDRKSSRQIAHEVFGDPKLKDRVLRILKSD